MPVDNDENDENEVVQLGGYYDDDGNEVPVIETTPAPIIPIDRERRYRELEAKCAKLESLLAAKTSLDLPTYRQERHGFRCGTHPRVIVSETTPTVWCAVCEEELDAIEVLRQYARKERNFVFGLQQERRESKRLQAEIEELKRVRANLKAQIRRGAKS